MGVGSCGATENGSAQFNAAPHGSEEATGYTGMGLPFSPDLGIKQGGEGHLGQESCGSSGRDVLRESPGEVEEGPWTLEDPARQALHPEPAWGTAFTPAPPPEASPGLRALRLSRPQPPM